MPVNVFENALLMTPTVIYVHQHTLSPETEEEMRQHPLHLYFICRTPKIFLDINKTKIYKDHIDYVFYSTVNGVREDYSMTTENARNPIGNIECEYPHTLVKAYNWSGKLVTEGKVNLIFHSLNMQRHIMPNILDMEVLYVGQAFGTDGNRITIDRLKNHEKALLIFDATQQKFPDYEVWFLSMSVEPTIMSAMIFTPNSFSAEELEQIKDGDINYVYPESIPTKEQITAAEAAFIKYFNTTEYNKEFLDFPKESKRFEECYNSDLNSIGIQLSTFDSIGMRLFSKAVPASGIHSHTFFLHEGKKRKDMFWMLKQK